MTFGGALRAPNVRAIVFAEFCRRGAVSCSWEGAVRKVDVMRGKSCGQLAGEVKKGVDVLLLEPLDVLRYGLESVLRQLDRIDILECHRSMEELFEVCGKEWSPDITIASCCAPGGVAAQARSAFPASRVLELISRIDPEHLAMATRTYADGYLLMGDINVVTLDGTLQALMRGDVVMPQPVADYLLDRARPVEMPPVRPWPYFSPRERDVIALLLEGLSNRQIADRVGISVHSAKRYVSSVLNKVNSPSRAHFVAQMLRGESEPVQQ